MLHPGYQDQQSTPCQDHLLLARDDLESRLLGSIDIIGNIRSFLNFLFHGMSSTLNRQRIIESRSHLFRLSVSVYLDAIMYQP